MRLGDGRTRKRRRRANEPGHVRELTFSCADRTPFLIEPGVAERFIAGLDSARRAHNVAIIAYVVMPEHVHLIVLPHNERAEVGAFLKSAKQPVAQWHLRAARRSSVAGSAPTRFWQPGGGYDRNLFESGAIHAAIDYVHANPVRRGLATTPVDWLWSSAAFWAGRSECPLTMDRIALS